MTNIDQIIERYLSGISSREEQAILLDFMRKTPGSLEYFEQKKLNWENNEEKTISLQEWESWQKIKDRISDRAKAKLSSSPIIWFYKIASVVAIIMLTTFLFGLPLLQKQKVIVSTNPGQTIKMVLPDKSSVILNSNSTLEYHPLAFMMKREIKLSGEAYFNIQKSKNTAFRVQSGDIEVKVLGTSFNVNAYPQSDCYKIVLEEGIVNVKSKKNKRKPIILSPGEMFKLSKSTNDYSVKKVNTRLYTSWKQGLLYFYDSSFSDVIDRVEKRYGTNIEIEENIINKFLISTTIRDEPLGRVLDLFKNVLPISISENGGIISIKLDEERYEKYTLKNKS